MFKYSINTERFHTDINYYCPYVSLYTLSLSGCSIGEFYTEFTCNIAHLANMVIAIVVLSSHYFRPFFPASLYVYKCTFKLNVVGRVLSWTCSNELRKFSLAVIGHDRARVQYGIRKKEKKIIIKVRQGEIGIKEAEEIKQLNRLYNIYIHKQ